MKKTLGLSGSMLLATVLVLGLLGCGEDDTHGSPDAAPPDASPDEDAAVAADAAEDGGTCLEAGEECTEADAEACCSGNCKSDICVLPYGECAAATQDCDDDLDCCTGNCGPSDKCVKSTDTCEDRADSCSAHYQCCDGNCANGTCTDPFGTCLSTGTMCDSNAECYYHN